MNLGFSLSTIQKRAFVWPHALPRWPVLNFLVDEALHGNYQSLCKNTSTYEPISSPYWPDFFLKIVDTHKKYFCVTDLGIFFFLPSGEIFPANQCEPSKAGG